MDDVTLNSKEQKRVIVVNQVLAGQLTGQGAAELLGISLRQTRRLLAVYRAEGVAGLAHGNRGRRPVNKLDPVVADEIVRLAGNGYRDFNDSHFTEELAERHQIVVSVPTVRRLRREAGLGSPRKRRAPRHRRLRQRYPQAGMLLQVDGSKHAWLEGRGPWLTLHAAIDDATNDVAWAVFREEEDATGYALLLHHISQTHGLPLALYADRHTIFQSPKQPSLEEQLQGLEPRSHLGHLLKDLEIELISARSPQAKGRVERLFQTLQDRLVKELRRVSAQNLAEANLALHGYLPRFNTRFTKPSTQSGSAYRPPLSPAQANERIHFTYWRTVANDHTIALFGHILPIPPIPRRVNLAGCRVALHHRMDGRLAVVFHDQLIGLIQPARLGPPRLEQFEPAEPYAAPQTTSDGQPAADSATPTPDSTEPALPRYGKPSPNHPWRRTGRAAIERRKNRQPN